MSRRGLRLHRLARRPCVLVAADRSGEIGPTGVWHLADPGGFEEFRQRTDALVPVRGVGLPGSVLRSGQAEWVVDLADDHRFVRGASAATCGLRSGFAFPVRAGGEVVAVLEFFSAETTPPEAQLLALIDHLGTQIGRVVERARTAAALRLREEQYRALVESALDAIVSCDAMGGSPISTRQPRASSAIALKRCSANR